MIGGVRSPTTNTDVFAFVALDSKQIAWLPVSDLTHKSGDLNLMIEFKTRRIEYKRARGKSGVDPAKAGRWIEDYAKFPIPTGVTEGQQEQE